jgi:peptidoglycan/LPS O-acetylase OafA/YrhL
VTTPTSQAWSTAARRGLIPILLGVACLVVSVPATEDLDPLLKVLGAIFIALGLLIVVATGRSLAAEEKRIGAPRS